MKWKSGVPSLVRVAIFSLAIGGTLLATALGSYACIQHAMALLYNAITTLGLAPSRRWSGGDV